MTTDAHGERRPWALETTAATVAYWATLVGFASALFRTRMLPLVDYPQHVAVAATLRRIWLGQVPPGLYETNLAGYNSLFHLVTAALGLAMPIELAGKLLLVATFVVFGFAAIAVMDAMETPRWRALFLLPLAVGYTFAYGFANYGLALALQLLVFARVVAGAKRAWITVLLALLGMYAHVLASAFVFVLLAVVMVFRRRPRALLAIAPAVVYCALVALVSHGTAKQNTEFVPLEGHSSSLAVKLAKFFHFVTGLRADGVDEMLMMAIVAFVVLGALASHERVVPVRAALFGVTVLLYFGLPHVFFATPFIFERVAALVVLTLVVMLPSPRESLAKIFRGVACVSALASAGLLWDSMNRARTELADVERVIDAAPDNRRLIGVVFDPHLPSFKLRAVLHAPAYYLARHPGELAWMFETISLPVRPIRTPEQRLPVLFELNPTMYDPRAPYARYFDLVLVKARSLDRAPIVRSGEWWLVENRQN